MLGESFGTRLALSGDCGHRLSVSLTTYFHTPCHRHFNQFVIVLVAKQQMIVHVITFQQDIGRAAYYSITINVCELL